MLKIWGIIPNDPNFLVHVTAVLILQNFETLLGTNALEKCIWWESAEVRQQFLYTAGGLPGAVCVCGVLEHHGF